MRATIAWTFVVAFLAGFIAGTLAGLPRKKVPVTVPTVKYVEVAFHGVGEPRCPKINGRLELQGYTKMPWPAGGVLLECHYQ